MVRHRSPLKFDVSISLHRTAVMISKKHLGLLAEISMPIGSVTNCNPRPRSVHVFVPTLLQNPLVSPSKDISLAKYTSTHKDFKEWSRIIIIRDLLADLAFVAFLIDYITLNASANNQPSGVRQWTKMFWIALGYWWTAQNCNIALHMTYYISSKLCWNKLALLKRILIPFFNR